MATIRKHWNKWQVLIRRQGHPHIAKSFTSYSDATKYAQESPIGKRMEVESWNVMTLGNGTNMKTFLNSQTRNY